MYSRSAFPLFPHRTQTRIGENHGCDLPPITSGAQSTCDSEEKSPSTPSRDGSTSHNARTNLGLSSVVSPTRIFAAEGSNFRNPQICEANRLLTQYAKGAS